LGVELWNLELEKSFIGLSFIEPRARKRNGELDPDGRVEGGRSTL